MLKLKRFDKAEWFDVPGVDGVRLLIKPASFSTATKLLSKAKRKAKIDGDIVDDYDDSAFALELFKETLVDFEGVEADGDLTKDQMKELMYDYSIFRDFVAAKSQELYRKIEEALEADLKN